MLAGLILTLVGIGLVMLVMTRKLDIPEYWMPLAVGAGLLLVGALRRGSAGGS